MYIPSETMWSQNKGLVELDVRRVGPYPIHVGIMVIKCGTAIWSVRDTEWSCFPYKSSSLIL